jgi:predicted nuclease with RNAse H fold
LSKKRLPANKNSPSDWVGRSLKRNGFVGIALSGGKSDKTCLAFLEYYPEHNKIFLSQVIDRIKVEGDISADLVLHEGIINRNVPTEYLAYNVPLTLPKCMTCKLKCPGYESCKEEEILWMWDLYRRLENEGVEKKLFTPYTERCVEQYLATELEEAFQSQHAFGANMAPLAARAHFINRRLKLKTIEVYPKLSLWRIGRALNIQKSHLRFHKHHTTGNEARLAILKELVRREIAFLYEQDVRLMTENGNAFDAFICALTAVLKFKGECEKRPKGFPKAEGWIEIPKETIVW